MESESERILRNLTVVGLINQNDKLSTNATEFSLYEPTSLRGMFRLYYGETRIQNVIHIQSTVRSAKTFIEQIITNYKEEHERFASIYLSRTQLQCCKRMYEALVASKSGLSNLKQTYKDDASIMTKLQTLIHEIDDFVEVTSASFPVQKITYAPLEI